MLTFRILALFLFIVGVLTDIYDGRWARKNNRVTPLGVLLDPLADKILVVTAFISFVGIKDLSVPAWMVAIIIIREFSITGLRLLACGEGRILSAEREGKQKTAVQMATVVIILSYLIGKTVLQLSGIWSKELEIWGRIMIYIVMSITVILTVSSGCHYLHRYRDIFLKSG